MTFAARRRAAVVIGRWQLAIVCALAVLAHGAATAGVFVFDDIHSVAANWTLQDASQWWRWVSDPTALSDAGAMFRPVVLLSLGLTFAIDTDPWLFKLTNVLLHAVVVGLGFGWLRRVGAGSAIAFAVAGLFAVHPLVSENMNLVSARSEVLLLLGLLLGLRGHLSWCRGGRLAPALALVLTGGVIACGSKETGVVLPALLVAQSWFVRRGSFASASGNWRRALVTIGPAVVFVFGYLLLRKAMLGEATVTLSGRTGEDPLTGYGRDMVTQLSTMGLLLPRALLTMVVPTGLVLDPHVPFRFAVDPLVAVGWGAVLLLAVVGLLPGPGAGVRRFGLALAGATALPWIVIPLNMPLAEHRLYGPLLGVLLAAAPWLPRRSRRALPLVGLLLLGIMLSTARALDFRSETGLWRREIENASTWRTWWGLGAAHLRAQDYVRAVEPLHEAYRRNPRHGGVLRNYAEALTFLPADRARPWRALALTDYYLRARPDDPWARTLSAQACLVAGAATAEPRWYEEAERVALSCLDVAEPKGLVYRMAATARLRLEDPAGALAHLDASLAAGRDHFTVRLMRAEVLDQLGRGSESQRERLQAARQNPTEPAVMRALRAARPGR
ncbi:MAG: hypothetical protein NXI31_00040 [bacterium]|nr:hypothetical protein [bacterium]